MFSPEIEVRTCVECASLYEVYSDRASPVRCPSCADRAQRRPTQVVQRARLATWTAEIHSLPGEWQRFQANKKDRPCWKIDLCGRSYGADWAGRIVIYAAHPFVPGDVVRVRLMRAEHRVRVVYRERHTLHHGSVVVSEKRHLHRDEGGEIETDAYEYLVFEPTDAAPDARITFTKAFSKTTLKGFGRQYRSDTVFEADPLWSKTIYGGYRSGRAGTNATLAIIAYDDPPPQVVTTDLRASRPAVVADADLSTETRATIEKLRAAHPFDDDED